MLIKCRDEPAALKERRRVGEGGREAGREEEREGERREILLYFSSFLVVQYPHY